MRKANARTKQTKQNKELNLLPVDTTINTMQPGNEMHSAKVTGNKTRINPDEIKKYNGQAAAVWGLK